MPLKELDQRTSRFDCASKCSLIKLSKKVFTVLKAERHMVQMLQSRRQIARTDPVCWDERTPCKMTATESKTPEDTPVTQHHSAHAKGRDGTIFGNVKFSSSLKPCRQGRHNTQVVPPVLGCCSLGNPLLQRVSRHLVAFIQEFERKYFFYV